MSEEYWKGVRLAVFKGKERFDRKNGRQRWCFKFEVQAAYRLANVSILRPASWSPC
jgi:hypothetical protein